MSVNIKAISRLAEPIKMNKSSKKETKANSLLIPLDTTFWLGHNILAFFFGSSVLSLSVKGLLAHTRERGHHVIEASFLQAFSVPPPGQWLPYMISFNPPPKYQWGRMDSIGIPRWNKWGEEGTRGEAATEPPNSSSSAACDLSGYHLSLSDQVPRTAWSMEACEGPCLTDQSSPLPVLHSLHVIICTSACTFFSCETLYTSPHLHQHA